MSGERDARGRPARTRFAGVGCRAEVPAHWRRFGVEGTPLLDVTAALTPLGWPRLARARAAPISMQA